MVGLGVGLFLLIAMLSLQAGRLVMGPFGNTTAGLFYGLAGVKHAMRKGFTAQRTLAMVTDIIVFLACAAFVVTTIRGG